MSEMSIGTRKEIMIGVITYNIPHRKTQDVLFRLKAYGYSDVECIAMEFINRKRFISLARHRNTEPLNVHPKKLCKNLGYKYTEKIDLKRYDKILIGGANILPAETIKEVEIINSHPGYLPYSRGLDSLKWAILLGYPIGVTTHVIDERIDAGEIIDRRIVEIDFYDSLQSLGMRVYEMEVNMLIEAMDNSNREPVIFYDQPYPARMKMPHRLEVKMLAKLEHLKLK